MTLFKRSLIAGVLASPLTVIPGAGNRDDGEADEGDDTIHAIDGRLDRARCCAGRDTVFGDTVDRYQGDCEVVN